MKLKELHESTDNEKKIREWLKPYTFSSWIGTSATPFHKAHLDATFDFKSMTVLGDIQGISLIGDNAVEFDWPLSKAIDHRFTLEVNGGIPGGLVFNNFENVPNATVLEFNATVIIKSFKGIEKLTQLKRLSFDIDHNIVECGLLRLLKVSSLKTIGRFSHTSNGGDDDLRIALDIIAAHMAKGRDVMACQNEMIDKGLEQYAKL